MAITAADLPTPSLPLVRRLEAAGFRAWPAADVTYDGSWQLRLTPGHPSKRLNGLVPLDPQDAANIGARLDAVEGAFAARGIAPAIRQSPLCPPPLVAALATRGWVPHDETLVMTADIDALALGEGIDRLPLRDVDRFAEACIAIDDGRDTTAGTIAAIIGRIEPQAGLFVIEEGGGTGAVGMCVQDNDLAGLQQIVVRRDLRRRGLGRQVVAAALHWAKLRGARQAWLQVNAANAPAIALYRDLGFVPAYTYLYWRKEAADG